MSLIILVTESAPARLRGRLSVWLLEVRAGVFVGNYGRKVREVLWERVCTGIEDGNAVLVWSVGSESGFDVATCGRNRRIPLEVDGMPLISFVVTNSG